MFAYASVHCGEDVVINALAAEVASRRKAACKFERRFIDTDGHVLRTFHYRKSIHLYGRRNVHRIGTGCCTAHAHQCDRNVSSQIGEFQFEFAIRIKVRHFVPRPDIVGDRTIGRTAQHCNGITASANRGWCIHRSGQHRRVFDRCARGGGTIVPIAYQISVIPCRYIENRRVHRAESVWQRAATYGDGYASCPIMTCDRNERIRDQQLRRLWNISCRGARDA